MTDLELLKKICDFDYIDKNQCNFSRYDLEAIKTVDNKPILDLCNMYAPNCIPHFFFGNIVNPKKIILGNNPSYSQIFEDIEYNEFRKDILNVYKNYSLNNYIDFTNELYDIRKKYDAYEKDKDIIPSKRGNGNRSTYEWWNDFVFKNSKFKIEETAIFNLVGYHSYSYNKIKSEAFKDKEKLYNYEELKDSLYNNDYNINYLPTTNMIVKYINNLLKEHPDIQIYYLWNKHDDWLKLLKINEDNIKGNLIDRKKNK